MSCEKIRICNLLHEIFLLTFSLHKFTSESFNIELIYSTIIKKISNYKGSYSFGPLYLFDGLLIGGIEVVEGADDVI